MIKKTNQPQPHSVKPPGFARGVLSIGGAEAICILSLFVEMMIAVRILDAASYGVYVLMITITNLVVMFIDCGNKTAMPQLITSRPTERQAVLVNSVIFFRVIILGVTLIVIWFGKNFLSRMMSAPSIMQYVIFIPLMVIGTSLDELFAGILQGFQDYNHIAIATFVRSLLRLVLSIVFLIILKLGMMALVYSWILSAVVSMIYQYLYIPIQKRLNFNWDVLSETLRFGFPLQTSRFIWFISGRVNVFLLGIMALPSTVACYDVSEKIPRALQNLSASFITVFYPSMASLWSEGKNKKAEHLLDQSLRLISVAMAFFALVAVLFNKEIVTIMFSVKYTSASSSFAILMIAFQMGFLVQLMGYTLTSAGYPGRSLIENTVRAILVIVGNIILIPKIGIVGAAFATLIANYISIPLSIGLLWRSKIPVRVDFFTRTALIFLICASSFWWFQPTSFIIKISILLLFIIFNLSLSSITRDEIALVLPKIVTRRIGVLQKV